MTTGLSYSGKSKNGIIFNETYHWGAIYNGEEYRPELSFDYFSFECHEYFDQYFVIENDGKKRLMTNEEIDEVMEVARNWVQPLGQEGNPTDSQKHHRELVDARNEFTKNALLLAENSPYPEMVSWFKQEQEARALKEDSNVSTPFLSKLAESRGLGETVEELADKVIANADHYNETFSDMLGAFQKQIKDIDAKYEE